MIKFLILQATNYGIIENPIVVIPLLLLFVIPGFFALGFIAIKIVTLFMISNKSAIIFSVFCSIVGILFILLLGYIGIN